MLLSLRLDRDVVEAFTATGSGWPIRMNDALARAARDLDAAG